MTQSGHPTRESSSDAIADIGSTNIQNVQCAVASRGLDCCPTLDGDRVHFKCEALWTHALPLYRAVLLAMILPVLVLAFGLISSYRWRWSGDLVDNTSPPMRSVTSKPAAPSSFWQVLERLPVRRNFVVRRPMVAASQF